MRKLLSANFHAILHSKRFWLLGLFEIGMAIWNIVSRYRLRAMGWDGGLDRVIIEDLPIIFLIMPAMAALFINTDYHDGTIRNKLTVGRTRTSVYLANLITSYSMVIFYVALHAAVVLLTGFPIGFDEPDMVAGKVFMFLVIMLSLMAISVFIATLVTNRSVLVWSVLMVFGMIFGAQAISDMMTNPPQTPDYSGVQMTTMEDADGMFSVMCRDKDGNLINPSDIPLVDNPGYVREPMRSFLRKYNEIQPGGQMMGLIGGYADLDEDGQVIQVELPWWETALYALGVTVVFTGLGVLIFRRKDLK